MDPAVSHHIYIYTHTNLSHSCPDRYYHSSSTILTYCVCFCVGLLTFVFDAEGVQVCCVLCAIFCPHFYSFQHTAHNITHCGPGNKQTVTPMISILHKIKSYVHTLIN